LEIENLWWEVVGRSPFEMILIIFTNESLLAEAKVNNFNFSFKVVQNIARLYITAHNFAIVHVFEAF
jgi:hypothetical protein